MMAQANFTEDEDQKTFKKIDCSAEFYTRGVNGELIFLSSLNIILSIAAFLGNTLILVALNKESSLHLPSKLLYRNLAITDLCVGIVVGPLAVIYWISVLTERWDICFYADSAVGFAGYTLCSVSLFTLTAISVDRLLALLLGLRYRQVVTYKRTCITAIFFWILSIGGSAFFFIPVIISSFQYLVTATCLITTILSYTKIFFFLRHNQINVHKHVTQGQLNQSLNMVRYRKAVNSALWVQGTMVVCYLPFTIAVALMPQRGIPISAYRAWHFTATLVYLNSSLDPLIYCWKISEVRKAVKDTIRELFCSLS